MKTYRHDYISYSSNVNHTLGYGVGCSMNLPKMCRRKANVSLYMLRKWHLSRLRIALFWDLEFPRTIPQNAEIWRFVESGNIDAVQECFSLSKSTPKDMTTHGTTFLHVASRVGNLKLMQLLIDQGGDVNARDEDGETPLHWAMAWKDHLQSARLLIENGADLANNATDKKTPLHTFLNNTVETVLFSTDWIEPIYPDSAGMSLVHFLSWSSKSTPRVLEQGLKYDTIPLWAADGFGRTCLHLAASRGNVGLLTYLFEKADLATLRQTDHHGRTALHYAAQSVVFETVELLVANGLDLYAKDCSQQNVLHRAAWWGNLKVAQKCASLDSTSSLISPDQDGNFPSHLVRGSDNDALRTYLKALEAATDDRDGGVMGLSQSFCSLSVRIHHIYATPLIRGISVLLQLSECFFEVDFYQRLVIHRIASLMGLVVLRVLVSFVLRRLGL